MATDSDDRKCSSEARVEHSHECMTKYLLSGDPNCPACGDGPRPNDAGSPERFERAKEAWKAVTGEDVSHLEHPRSSEAVSVPLGPPLKFSAPPGTFEECPPEATKTCVFCDGTGLRIAEDDPAKPAYNCVCRRPTPEAVIPRAESSVHVTTKLSGTARRIQALGLIEWQEKVVLGLVTEMANIAFDEGYIRGLSDADERKCSDKVLPDAPTVDAWYEILERHFPEAGDPHYANAVAELAALGAVPRAANPDLESIVVQAIDIAKSDPDVDACKRIWSMLESALAGRPRSETAVAESDHRSTGSGAGDEADDPLVQLRRSVREMAIGECVDVVEAFVAENRTRETWTYREGRQRAAIEIANMLRAVREKGEV